MKHFNIFPETIFSLGPVSITDTVLTTWIVMAIIIIVVYIFTRNLSIKPTVFQEVLEAIIEAM